MADQKISALTAVGSLAGTDEFAVNSTGASKKVTGTQIATFVATANASSTTPAAIGTAAVGVGTTFARADHVHATGAGTPSTQAFGDAAATGAGPAAAMSNHKHAMPAFATNALAFGTAAAAGVATAPFRSDDTIAIFDGTAPTTQAFNDAAAVGTAAFAARRDHKHGMPTSTAGPDANITIDAAGAAGTANTTARAGHGHQLITSATAAVALGAAAAGTSGHSPSRDDHVHPTTGLALDPHGAAQHTDIARSLFLSAALAALDVATASTVGASPDLTKVVAYADAATQGAYWTFQVPADWASGVITIQPVWSPGSTDGTAHTVRWSVTAKTAPSGSTVTGAGTTTAFTGSSAARTAGVLVYDTATSTTLTPAAANDLFRFELQRIGADAADTYVGVVNLLGVVVTYTANQ